MGPALRLLAVWLFTIAFLGLIVCLHAVTLRQLPPRWISGLIRLWGRGGLAILGIRLELVNRCTLDERLPRVVVINHQSSLDVLWGACVCPPAPLVIGKREVIYFPIVNLAWLVFDFVLINRADRAKAIQAVNRAGRKIHDQRRSLVLAPEGTRTPDGSILPFKMGAFHIARDTGAAIYPMVVWGAFELLPKSAVLPRRGVIRVEFLDPIPSRTPAGDPVGESELRDRVRSEMARVYARGPVKPSSSAS
jgi:1-acyl-sn-glycerol-3-phosphate acyltransferase